MIAWDVVFKTHGRVDKIENAILWRPCFDIISIQPEIEGVGVGECAIAKVKETHPTITFVWKYPQRDCDPFAATDHWCGNQFT